ncbi:MAG: hypothetical protein ACRBF0_01435 [Calditrichia bacterium]
MIFSHSSANKSRLNNYPFTFLLVFILLICGCESKKSETQKETSEESSYTAAIKMVLEKDSALGAIRNNAPKDTTLAQTVRNYSKALRQIDFSKCPQEFTSAFKAHIESWEASIEFLETYPALRGELHEAFDSIRSRGEADSIALAAIEKPIWDTWKIAEDFAKAYGAKNDSQH